MELKPGQNFVISIPLHHLEADKNGQHILLFRIEDLGIILDQYKDYTGFSFKGDYVTQQLIVTKLNSQQEPSSHG